MNEVMSVLLFIAALIAVLLVLGWLRKSEYTIQRTVLIQRPLQEVFDYIVFLNHHGNFSKWMLMDPNMRKSIRGMDGAVGCIYSWDSDNKQVGKGEQEITAIQYGERIDYELRFQKPFASVAKAWITTEPDKNNHTIVTWAFAGSMNYPMRVMRIFFNLEKMLGNDLATSLINLKTLLEK